MKIGTNNRKADKLLILLLFGVFAVCILSVLLTGADIYHRLASRDQHSYDQRTATQYLTTRVHQADRLGDILVRDFEGHDALVFSEVIEDETFETLVYCHDGYLRELFTAAGSGFMPQDGEKILAAQDLSMDQNGRLLTLELIDPTGEALNLNLYLRCGKGASE